MPNTLLRIWRGEVPAWTYLLLAAMSVYGFHASSVRSIETEADLHAALKGDPALGTLFPGLAEKGFSSTYVMVLSSCACNVDKIRALLKFVDRKHVGLHLVITMQPDKMRNLYSIVPPFVEITADPELAVGIKLNATFIPRAYFVDSRGKLFWKQDDAEVTMDEAYAQARKAASDLGVAQ